MKILNKLNNEKTFKTLALASFALFACALCGRIFITNSSAIKSTKMQELANQKETLEKEVSLLSLEASTLSSMSRIESEAQNLGFVAYVEDISVIGSPSFAALPSY